MRKQILNQGIIQLVILCIFFSCSEKSLTNELIEEKISKMSGRDMLMDLLIMNDNNIYQLARIFECHPSSLKRIFEEVSYPTDDAKKHFQILLHNVLLNGSDVFLKEDPEIGWFKRNFLPEYPKKHPNHSILDNIDRKFELRIDYLWESQI